MLVFHVACSRSLADRTSRAGRLRPSSLLCALVLVFTMMELRANTTIYVGKHFEVRDHDQPTKYVFNGSTRVARITGSLSTNTRIQRFRLRPGWNLLSLAVGANDLSEQLQRPGVVVSAHSWNPQTGNYALVPHAAPAGTVLWVNASTNAAISVVGNYSDPVNRDLSAGATYIASTGLEAWTPTFSLSLAAWSFDPHPSTLNPQPTWLVRLTGDLSSVNELPRTFAPGQALYIINEAPFELEAPDPALRIRYYHHDHLGSSSVMTDANGALVEETAFYPFGDPRHEHRLRQIEEAYKFTQKERDRESGLHYFSARYFAGGLSRFVTADPKYLNPEALSPSGLTSPQAMNLYTYVHSNPLRYVDPTGLDRRDIGFDAKDIREVWTSPVSVEMKRAERPLNVVGGALMAAGGVAACATIKGCVIGAPMIMAGSDRIAAGITGGDTSLPDAFHEGMDLVSFAAGGAQLARSIGARALAAQSAKMAGGGSDAGFKLLSPVYQYGGRDIVIVRDAAGRVQPMYRSTGWAGKTHGVKPGEWGPFDDVMGGQLMKSNYYGGSGLAKTDPLYGFGTAGNKAMSQWLGGQSLPAGHDVGDVFSIINSAIAALK